jgi:hypothetical protein
MRASSLLTLAVVACSGTDPASATGESNATSEPGTTGTTGTTGEPTTSAEPTTTGDTTTAFVTYHQHVRPILEARCVACHHSEGVGPFALASYADASTWAQISVAAVDERRMPPFMPDDSGCWPIADTRKMEPWEQDLLREWLADGTPEGDPNSPPEVQIALPQDTLGPPTRSFADHIIYTPDTADGDDYRCFRVDPGLAPAWTFFKAIGVDADNQARIHHAIIHAVPPELVAATMQIDAETPAQGWPCYFGPGVVGAYPVGGHSPGAPVRPYADGTSVPLAAGTQFIVELHFHETFNQDPIDVAITSWEFPAPVLRVPHGLSMFTSNFVIPANAPSVTAPLSGRIIPADQEPEIPLDPNAIQEARAGQIWGVDFHMHMRGKTARVDLVRKDGTRECLLRVPEWQGAWQGAYTFTTPLQARAGDTIEATCEWDNSPEHQPIIDGVRLESTDLYWGFDALDEMCNAYVSMTLD